MSKSENDGTAESPPFSAPSEDDIRESVRSVLASQVFANSPRLKEFLTYVVEEFLAGRGANLSAKSIGYHLYGRDAQDETNSANFVRVEARRLRRFLSDYYETDGQSDNLRIHIDKGGYVPRFERLAIQNDAVPPDPEINLSKRSPPTYRLLALVGAAILSVAVSFLGWRMSSRPSPPPIETAARVEREALMEQSPAALEASNTALQARGLIYPIFDGRRQLAATELFRAAISADPNSAIAHAGAAQTLGSLALLSIEGDQHDAYLAEARLHRDTALELDAGHEWVQSAAGWVAFVERDFEDAARYSERALSLEPENGNVLDFYGVIAVASGAYEKGLDAGDRNRRRRGDNTRFAYLNILGSAHYHLEQYEEAVAAFEESNASGGPLSALGVMYLAASYAALGKEADGRRLVAQLQTDWPGFPIGAFLHRLHRSPDEAQKLVDRLTHLGWAQSD